MIGGALLLLALQALPAPGAVQWELVVDDREGQTYIDPASLVRDGDVVRVLNRLDPSPAMRPQRMPVVVRVVFDCRRITFGLEAYDQYDDGGRFVRSGAASAQVNLQPLGSSPSHNRMHARVCGRPRP